MTKNYSNYNLIELVAYSREFGMILSGVLRFDALKDLCKTSMSKAAHCVLFLFCY